MSMLVSVVIPTYKEVDNIPLISQQVAEALTAAGWQYEIVFVDDNSQDGSFDICASLAETLPVRMIVRTEEKGLATAVIRGLEEAKGQYVVVMDADLSHPATAIPEMVAVLQNQDGDFVVGSRYIKGGSMDESWGFFRRFNSLVATWLALPLVKVRDPMSGFFAFERSKMPATSKLSPIGYKIGLELLIKGGFQAPREVPIHFEDRVHGESKLSLSEQMRYLRHLRRLYQHKYTTMAEFVQFGLVGASGFVVDLIFYLLLQFLFGMSHVTARAVSFWGAASWNWAANRLITFTHRQKTSKLVQWPSFILSSLLGFGVNWGSYYMLTSYVPFFSEHLVLALIVGVLMGMGFNFTMARMFVFLPYEEEIASETKGDIKKR